MTHSESLRRRATRSVLWNTWLTPLNALMAITSSVLAAMMLGIDGYASYALALAVVATVLGLTDLGVSTAASRTIPIAAVEHGRRGVTELLLNLVGFRAALGLFLSIALITLLPKLDLVPDARLPIGTVAPQLGLLLFVDGLALLALASLAAFLEQRSVLIATLCQSVTRVLLFALLLAAGAGELATAVDVIVASSLVRLAVASSLLGWQLRAHGGADMGRSLAAGWWRDFVAVAAAAWWDKTINLIHSRQFLVVVAARFLRPRELGLLALAFELAERVIAMLLSPVNGLALPLVAEHFARNRDAAQRSRAFQHLMRGLALLLLPAAGIAAAAVPHLLAVLYPPEFVGAALALRILILLGAVEFVFYTAANAVLLVAARYREFLLARTWSLGVVLLYVPAIGTGSAAWIAAANGLAQIVSAVLLFFIMFVEMLYLRVPVADLSGATLAAAGATAAASLAAAALATGGAWWSLFGTLAGIPAGLLLLVRAGVIHPGDVDSARLLVSTLRRAPADRR